MFRRLKNRMVVLTVMALMLAQIVPASALTITFTTATAPIKILSTTIAQNQTGVAPEFLHSANWNMKFNFSRAINSGWNLYSMSLRRADNNSQIATQFGADWGSSWVSVWTNDTLPTDTEFYFEVPGIYDSDGNYLDSSDAANSPYFYSADNNGTYRLYFTTGYPSWGSTVVNGVAGALTGGETNFPVLNASVKVTANNPLQSSTVNTVTVVLHEGSADGPIIAAAVSLDADGKTVIVSPSVQLKYSTTYYIVLIGVTDTLGTAL